DLARDCAAARLPPRRDVVLLTGDALTYDQAWPLASTMGAETVAALPEAAAWLTRRLAPASASPPRAPMVAVTGARGGIGASVLAAGTALTAADAGRRVLLIDGDSGGGGLDVVLGWEHREGLRWHDVAVMEGPFDPERLRVALPNERGLGVLSFDRDHTVAAAAETAAAVADAGRRGHDLVVVDLPRCGESWLRGGLGQVELLIVVVPAEVRAVAAARRLVADLSEQCDRVRLVVRGPSPVKLRTAEIAEVVGRPLAAELSADARLRAAVETSGLDARACKGGLAAAARTILSFLDTRASAPNAGPAPALAGSAR
ncbi:MAG: septum site-determining protein Ssd, partial [Stackebrandtia sp.]